MNYSDPEHAEVVHWSGNDNPNYWGTWMLSPGVEAIKRFDPSKFPRQKTNGFQKDFQNHSLYPANGNSLKVALIKNTATPAAFIAIFRNGLQKVFPKNLKKDLA